jgi:hypothetical protein
MSQNNAQPGQQSGELNINQIEETAMNIVYNVASIVTLPVECFLRVHFGTRYFAAPIAFMSAMMLIIASAFVGVATSAAQMIPFAHVQGPVGLYGLGSFTGLFFLASFIHGIRTWRRMIHLHLEVCSTFEGPPLFFFQLLPRAESFWFCRLVYEPVFVVALAVLLARLHIIQTPLEVYLQLAAIFLAMKSYVSWYKTWAYIRGVLDMRNCAPVIAKMLDDSASETELARAHLARLPKDLPADIRRDTAAHIARGLGFAQSQREETSHD